MGLRASERSNEHRTRRRVWPLLTVGFTALLAIVAAAGLASLQRSQQLNATVWRVTREHRRNDRLLRIIRSELQASSIALRDFLLDRSERNRDQKEELRTSRIRVSAALAQLSAVGVPDVQKRFERLRSEVNAYLKAAEPILDWSPAQKEARSARFLRDEVLPKRTAALAVMGEIEKLEQENVDAQETELDAGMRAFGSFIAGVELIALAVSIAIAIMTIWRIAQLESVASMQYEHTLRAQEELRSLSRQLVSAQEQERRAISRELHDDVGQMLTGLRMDLASLERLHGAPKPRFDARLEEIRSLAEQILACVRDLAMGIRPAILDDLGLEPALNWQARQFARRYDVPVTLDLHTDLKNLPEAHRTAIYRVVQEALTNCARHARARSIRVSIEGVDNEMYLRVEDDGRGCLGEPGLGLLGMQERVRDLGGSLSIGPGSGGGTVVSATIPREQAAAHA